MTIAIFTDTYKPEINGVVTSIDLFRRELLEQGHTVYLFCPNYNRGENSPSILRFPSIPYFFPLMKERRFAFPSARVLRKVKELGVEVIHSHVPGNVGIFALRASRKYRIPHVHTYHTLYMKYVHYMPLPKAFTTRAVMWISRKFLGRCQRVIAPSSQIRDEVLSYGVDAPFDVIPTGIDVDGKRAGIDADSLRRQYGLPRDKHILCYAGRVAREKNIVFLLKVAAHLLTTRDDLHLVIVGDGPDRPEIMKDARALGLDGHVTFTGYVPRPTVFAFYRAARVFVFSSLTETQGLVLLEALSEATPFVAIDAMGVGDLQRNGRAGFLTTCDVGDFSRAVSLLLDHDDLWREKKAQARALAEELSIPVMTRRLVASYRLAIEDFRRHGLPRYGKRDWEPPRLAPSPVEAAKNVNTHGRKPK